MPRLLQFIHGRGVLCQRGAGMNCNWLQDMSRRQTKVFRCSSFSKMLPRCGRVAHICGANLFLRIVFPAAIAFFETFQFAILWFIRNELQIQTRQRGNCSTLAGKSRGGTPFCRTLKIVFPKNCSCKTLHLGKPPESGSAESLRCLPLCCSPVVALSELPMNLS